jgi:transcriptional regulator of acetoin/glycerol metabolism
LTRGERREGWGATLCLGSAPPLRVSVTVAPIAHDPEGRCDPRVSYVVELRAVSSASSNSELDRLRAALEAHQWRREEAARALGMSRTTLWRKMREHALLHPAASCNA